mmetsp:Transcript_86895/g.251010  ORF Transcript_86895/g.251010 Transcript_86895/m.251010 type:complete len:177 (+) Transcript_86895:75-605(+)
MSPSIPACVNAVLVAGCLGRVVDAWESYKSVIPNGELVMRNGQSWFAVGHVTADSGGERNPFGVAFASAGYEWNADLCKQDSDGDGQTNGHELGDPDCVWMPDGSAGAPFRDIDISHPGFADSKTGASGGGGFGGLFGGGDDVGSGEVEKDGLPRAGVAVTAIALGAAVLAFARQV